MLLALLSMEFKTRQLDFLGNETRINYAFYDYNPRIEQIQLDAPSDANATFVFQHATRKVIDLEISGSYGTAKEVGLVWNEPEIRIFGLILQMNVTKDAHFYIARRAIKILVFQGYFEVQGAVVHMDSAHRLTSVVDTTFDAMYLINNGTPFATFVRQSATFMKTEQLSSIPSEYEEPCGACQTSGVGKACSECTSGTTLDNTGNCACVYTNLAYNEYYSNCEGVPANFSTPISSGKHQYFMECQQRLSIYVDYTYSSDPRANVSLFKDDSCGLSNLKINATLIMYSNNNANNSLVGLAYQMTKNISNLDLFISLENQNWKLETGSMMFITSQPNNKYTIENIKLLGDFAERGRNRNGTAEFHYNGMFRSVDNVVLNITNMSFSGYDTYSYWDGMYCSMGAGTVVNSTINVRYLYFGDNYTNSENPMTLINIEKLPTPEVDCEDKMSDSMRIEVGIFKAVPLQLHYEYNDFREDEGKKMSGFAGKIENSRLTFEMTLISLANTNTYTKSRDLGIVAVEALDSTILINQSTFTANCEINGLSGLIGNVSGATSNISISASVNLTSKDANSGVIGHLQGGNVQFSVYLEIKFKGANSGGLIGQMSSGTVVCNAAFGTVALGAAPSEKEVGLWTGGTFDAQKCDSGDCVLTSPETSYINIINTEEGYCGPKISLNEPIGSAADQYFFECASNKKFFVSYEGAFQYGNASLLRSVAHNCTLINIKVQGTISVTGQTGRLNLSGLVHANYNDIQNIITDIVLEDLSGQVYQASLVAISCTMAVRTYEFTNIILRGQMKFEVSQFSCYRIGGLASVSEYTLLVRNIALYGVEINVYQMYYGALVIGYIVGSTTYNNLIIDDYRESLEIPNFLNVSTTANVDFPCTNKGDAVLQLGVRFKNLLVPSAKKSFLKSTSSWTDQCGGLYGYLNSPFWCENATINTDSWISAENARYSGAITGEVYNGPERFNNTFISGEMKIAYATVFGYVWDNTYANFSIQYKYSETRNTMFGLIESYYPCQIRTMVDITMTGSGSAGFISQYTYNTKIWATGIIRKCADCTTYGTSMYYDTPPSDWVCSISNTDECPA